MKTHLYTLIITLVLVFCMFTGCTANTDNINLTDAYIQVAENQNLQYEDILSSYSEFNYYQKAYQIKNSELDYQIDIYEFTDSAFSKELYKSIKNTLRSEISTSSEETISEDNEFNFKEYYVTVDKEFYYVAQYKTSLIYIFSSTDSKETVLDFIEEIKIQGNLV